MNGSNNEVFSANGNFANGIAENGNAEHNTFVLAPGAERHANGGVNGLPGTSGIRVPPPADAKLVMDYTTDFPKLPDAPVVAAPTTGAWTKRPAIKSTEVTEVFKLSASERASRGLGRQFGNISEEQQKCNQVSSATGTKIELCEAKDQSLTILITGKRTNVEDARTRLVRELQTQANVEVRVPKEHHGVIIGKEGSKLRQLEQEYLCRIFMPGRDEKSDIIRIVGPGEKIAGAAQRIRDISGEAAKQGSEAVEIPRSFYPWIRGPFNETLDRISTETGAKINIPPPSAKNETIHITGTREGVDKAAAELRKIYESKKDTKSITCKVPKAQHRYIIGTKRSGLDEVLRETDVVIEVPAEDVASDVITLRGPHARLGDALALVYARATSVISKEIKYSEWMRRFIIGPKGATLQALVPRQEKLKIDFEDGGVIYLEGPLEAVNNAFDALTAEINRLSKDMASEAIRVPSNLHRHIIGKNGANVNKIKEDFDVQISIPSENANTDEIRIEGNKDGVRKAVDAVKEIVKRLENEKSRDIIIEQRFHGQVIGKNAENLQKWRQQFPSVFIAFPEATKKSDIVTLRGEKKEVDTFYAVLTKLQKELQESNYQETVSIFKDYYKHIIGKNGSNINKIREETNTRIELPAQGDGRVTVIGKQANVEKAIAKLNKIQNELASIVTTEVTIPNKIHTRLLGNGRRLIRDIEDEFGGVHILFPKEKTSDKVTIRGPKDDVARAEKALKEVAKHCEETTEEVAIPTKAEYIKFLIGREGANVKKLREKYPSVRIIFPSETDADLKIWVIGKKEEVEAVRKSYEKQIAELNETVELQVEVEPKYHKHFVFRGAEVLKEIQNEYGGVIISFPRQETGDKKVTIKGSKQCAESAKARILEIVGDLEAQVTLNVDIPETHHRSLIGSTKDLTPRFNVRIRFPARGAATEADANGAVDGIAPANLVQITGRDTNCEKAKEALLELIPITETIAVPTDYHSSLIGRGGEAVRKLMTDHAVRVKIPTAEDNSQDIAVTGVRDHVHAAIEEIREKVAELDRQSEDRKMRSFKVSLEVPLKYHQRLIGPGGAAIREMSARHTVQMSIPRSESGSETITITGYEKDANACKEEIEKLIESLDSMVSQEISLDARFHPRLIGARGRNLRKIQEEHGVEIRLPGRNDPNPNLVVVAGKTEDAVYDCIDKLRGMEEDFLADFVDRGHYMVNRHEPQQEKANPQQVEIKGAPWQLDSMDQFPAMGAPNASAPTQQGGSVWGQRRW
jgi:transcription antitermination factor NusA-like protein